MTQFTVGKHTYSAGALSARDQFHIIRRLAPFLSAIAPVAAAFKGKEGSAAEIAKGMSEEELGKILPALGNAIASMDDATADYVIFGLLAVVRRQEPQGLGWAPVAVGTQMAFEDIGMADMLNLAMRALMANAKDFFSALNSALSQAGQKQSAQ